MNNNDSRFSAQAHATAVPFTINRRTVNVPFVLPDPSAASTVPTQYNCSSQQQPTIINNEKRENPHFIKAGQQISGLPSVPQLPGSPAVPQIPCYSTVPQLSGSPSGPQLSGSPAAPQIPYYPGAPQLSGSPPVPQPSGSPSVPQAFQSRQQTSPVEGALGGAPRRDASNSVCGGGGKYEVLSLGPFNLDNARQTALMLSSSKNKKLMRPRRR